MFSLTTVEFLNGKESECRVNDEEELVRKERWGVEEEGKEGSGSGVEERRALLHEPISLCLPYLLSSSVA